MQMGRLGAARPMAYRASDAIGPPAALMKIPNQPVLLIVAPIGATARHIPRGQPQGRLYGSQTAFKLPDAPP